MLKNWALNGKMGGDNQVLKCLNERTLYDIRRSEKCMYDIV